MTLQQLYDFADATDHLSRMPLTREQARCLVREIEAQLSKDTPAAFDVVKQVQQSEARGCVKREFARRVEQGMQQ